MSQPLETTVAANLSSRATYMRASIPLQRVTNSSEPSSPPLLCAPQVVGITTRRGKQQRTCLACGVESSTSSLLTALLESFGWCLRRTGFGRCCCYCGCTGKISFVAVFFTVLRSHSGHAPFSFWPLPSSSSILLFVPCSEK